MALKKIGTHPLPFHADDLIAGTLMRAYFTHSGHEVSFIFSRDPEVLQYADAVVDTGGVHNVQTLRFDHHQDKNAVKAATGLVASFLTQKHEFRWLSALLPAFDRVDAADLGRSSGDAGVSKDLALFNPTWRELRNSHGGVGQDVLEHSFLARALPVVTHALDAAYHAQRVGLDPAGVFESSITNHPEVARRKDEIEKAKFDGQSAFIRAAMSAKGGVVYTEQGVEFAELFSSSYLDRAAPDTRQSLEMVNYVVFPAKNGGYSAVAVPTPDNPMLQKYPFPESWRSKRGSELMKEVSAITGRDFGDLTGAPADYFCHHSGFFLTMPDPVAFNTTLSFCAKSARYSSQTKHTMISDEAWEPLMDY